MPAAPPAPRLDANDVANLLQRADASMAVGDIASARLLLRRAAEAGDYRAALALGATYDPVALEKLGVRGALADVAMARMWYDRARELGAPDAQSRIEMLANRAR